MTNDEVTETNHEAGTEGERVNPATNTTPPSNPETDRDAVDKGTEKLDQIVPG